VILCFQNTYLFFDASCLSFDSFICQLYADGNNFSDFPLGGLPESLVRLNFGFNSYEELPVGGFPSGLEILNLKFTKKAKYGSTTWKHIYDTVPESVIELYVDSMGLVGPITTVDKLSNLANLYVGDNALNGTLPEALFMLPNLQEFGASNNNLTGIPGDLQNNRLRRLFLNENMLQGEVPLLPHTLQQLDLDLNNMSGELPDLAQIPLIERLILSRNNFHGILNSETFANNPKLAKLDLSFNNLTGSLHVSNLEHLQKLSVKSSDLSSSKTFPDFSRNQMLESVDLRNCSLSGSLPDVLCNLSHLVFVDVSYNNLSSLPACSFSSDDKNRHLSLVATNNILETIPASIWNSTDLNLLNLQHNKLTFTGAMPPPRFFIPKPALRALILSQNPLNVNMQDFVDSFSPVALNLATLQLHDCQLQGNAFCDGGFFPFIVDLDLSNNPQLGGSALRTMYND